MTGPGCHWFLVTLLMIAVIASNFYLTNGSRIQKNKRQTSDLAPNPNQLFGPTFTSSFPREVISLNTKGAVIACTASSKPAPQIEWLWLKESFSKARRSGNGRNVSNWISVSKSGPGLLEQLQNGSLKVSEFSEDGIHDRERLHVYKVTCRASNNVGTIVSPEIHIRTVLLSQHQSYNIQLMDVFTAVGNTAVFLCTINPYFLLEFVKVIGWQEGNVDIKPAEGRFSILDYGDLRSGKLHVRNVTLDDHNKMFRCLTRNVLTGVEKNSDPAKLIVVEAANSPPKLIDYVSSQLTPSEGSTIELPCVANAYPGARYRWLKNGLPLKYNDFGYSYDSTYSFSEPNADLNQDPYRSSMKMLGGNLLIENIQKDDTGEYKCVASNYIGFQEVVLKLNVAAPITAYIEPQTQTVDSGNEATMHCRVRGYPVQKLIWLKDGRVIEPDNEERFEVDGENNSTLKISDIRRSDAGMYQCVVMGMRGDVSHSSAQLFLGSSPPLILNTLSSQYIDPGTRISITCIATGNPLPAITWSVDGEAFPLTTHDTRISVGEFLNESGMVTSHVNITGARVQDGGKYVCTAANDIGIDSRETELNVFGVPYIKPMKNITALAGSELLVDCHVTGFPVKQIFWKKGVMALPTNHRQAMLANGTLLVSRVNRHLDEGWYSCHVVSPTGQGMNRNFHVRVIEPPKLDPFQFPSRKQGDRVSVSCVMSSGDLPMTLEWRKDGDVIDPDLGVQVHQSGAYSSFLSIEYATPRHNGNYTCIVTNEGSSTNHTSQLHIDVPPAWLTEPEDTSVVLSETAVIKCQTFGDPQPKINWKKSLGGIMSSYEDIDLREGEDSRVSYLDNGSLVISSAVKEDQGFYMCHASNNIGPDLSKVVQLTVNVPAHFKVHDLNVSAPSGESAILECLSEGDLPTSISWSFNHISDWSSDPRSFDHVLTGLYKVTSFSAEKGQGSRLTINHVNRIDSGFYVCSAKNDFGSDVASVHLSVLEPPDPPTDLVKEDEGSNWVKLNWKTGFNGNSKISSYLVEIVKTRGSWNELFRSAEVPAPATSVTIDGLVPASSYDVRIKAVNSAGIGRASNIISFNTPETEPSVPPSNVSAVAVASQSVLVTWEPVSESHSNGEILGYYLGYRKYNSSAPYSYVTVTNGNSHQLDNLEKFSTYSIHVQAYNKKGMGPRSEDISVMTLEDVPSQPPEKVVAESRTSQSISASWAPPPLYTLNGILHGYKVLYKYVREDEDESDAMSLTTDKLSATLTNLRKYTNYSIQVLAYTKMGEGVASSPLYITTKEDVPDMPADIKALVASLNSIMVVWKPPLHSNGLLTKYVINVTHYAEKVSQKSIEVAPDQHSFLLTELRENHRYGIKVAACTKLGRSDMTREVVLQTVEKVSARIANFPSIVLAHWHNMVQLDCLAIGSPEPAVLWKRNEKTIDATKLSTIEDNDFLKERHIVNTNKQANSHRNNNNQLNSNSTHIDNDDNLSRFYLLPNGTLLIADLIGSDSDSYKCRAENMYGADEVTTKLIVQAPPNPPILTVTSTTANSIQVSWKTASNGGSKIQGFRFYKKLEHGDWSSVDLDASNRSHLMTDLLCGSSYSFYIEAFNRMGMGPSSELVSARTEGSAPIFPPQSMILETINSTYVTLSLNTWESGGCAINSYDVAYQVVDDRTWRNVQKGISSNTTSLTVTLNPGTWYVMRVTAHNDAGSTECLLRFSTLTYKGGSTVEPQLLVRRLGDSSFFSLIQKLHVAIPASVALIVVFVVVSVAIGLFCYRRKNLNESDKSNAGVGMIMVVDDDVAATDQNEENEYHQSDKKERVREARKTSKKERQTLLKKGIINREARIIVTEEEESTCHPTTMDDEPDRWYAGIPRDGFPDGSEHQQTAKNSSSDLRYSVNCLATSVSNAAANHQPNSTCTCNTDSGCSTLATTNTSGGRSCGGGCSNYHISDSSDYQHYHVVSPSSSHGHEFSNGADPRVNLFVPSAYHQQYQQHHKHHQQQQHQGVVPHQHHPTHSQPANEANFMVARQMYGNFGSPYAHLTCTCDHESGATPADYSNVSINRSSKGSDVIFPPPPPSEYLSRHSSDVRSSPPDSLITTPTSTNEVHLANEYTGLLRQPRGELRLNVMT